MEFNSETVITRFNNKTRTENRKWREDNNLEHGCIYNLLQHYLYRFQIFRTFCNRNEY